MKIEVQLTREPIRPARVAGKEAAGAAGAHVGFRGVVRGQEDGRAIAALEYEAYEPMAVGEMRRVLEELGREHRCLEVRVVHRLGVVPVGEAAIAVEVVGRHRAEAFALLEGFMNRLKQDVPIWKRRGLQARDLAAVLTQPQFLCEKSGPGVEEVLALVRAHCRPLTAERVELDAAVGRVLRQPARAPEDQPPFDRSAVDGYAVRLDDAASELRLVSEIRAGDWKPKRLRPGEAVRIATGGALPAEGLQVVMKEDAEARDGTVRLLRRGPGRNIRFRGEDARRGEVLVEQGTVLLPGCAALLASVGHVRPTVTRLPRVLHVATGNEIVPPGRRLRRGQIRDSNSTLVRAFLGRFDLDPVQLRVAEDHRAALKRIAAALAAHGSGAAVDLLLVSGGASVGEHDFTRALFEDLGYRVLLCRTNTRPGKPLIFATRGGALAFGLAGNPLAHFVCLNLFVRAALEKWAGLPDREMFGPGVLAQELRSDGNMRETLWPAHAEAGPHGLQATPLRWRSSGDLTSLATANALLRVPPGCRSLPADSDVALATLFP
jgi:molybdopterin molybdotransferase